MCIFFQTPINPAGTHWHTYLRAPISKNGTTRDPSAPLPPPLLLGAGGAAAAEGVPRGGWCSPSSSLDTLSLSPNLPAWLGGFLTLATGSSVEEAGSLSETFKFFKQVAASPGSSAAPWALGTAAGLLLRSRGASPGRGRRHRAPTPRCLRGRGAVRGEGTGCPQRPQRGSGGPPGPPRRTLP